MSTTQTIRTISAAALWTALASAAMAVEPAQGPWRGWLDSPGGELPFEMELARADSGWKAWVFNGEQKIDIPQVALHDGKIVLAFTHYDAAIEAEVSEDGRSLAGVWKKRSSKEIWAELPFRATAGRSPRFAPDVKDATGDSTTISGKWAVQFSKSTAPAVGEFHTSPDGAATGTFMTPMGDYGYLAGRVDGHRLRLSSFDGSHAFLFDATLQAGGALAGDFWSRDTWHETWTARRDETADLPDAFQQTKATERADLSALSFRDLDGQTRSLGEFAGKATVIEVFGSWCPNCHDASELLGELYTKYSARGLSVVGLAFEITGEFERDVQQVRRFMERHGGRYPVLIGGVADKKVVADSLPMLEEFKAYPTFIFLDGSGRVQAVYTGFSGPATGETYHKLRRQFESLVLRCLGES